LQKFGRHATAPQAIFERAKVMALQNDVGGAMNELRRFTVDPLRKTTIAPLALLHLATIQRGQNRPGDAVATLDAGRKAHEDALTRDPARAGWVQQLRYHHAVALREVGRLEEARGLFEQVAKGGDGHEAWDAALRAGQCRKLAGQKKIADATKQPAGADKRLADAMQDVRTAATYLTTTEKALRARKLDEEQQRALAPIRSRMLYESAWGWREVARLELESARKTIQRERWQKRRDDLARATPPGQAVPAVALPVVEIRDVPVQPAETQARQTYRALIGFPDLAINADARFELAELLAQRHDHDEAIKLLQVTLEGEKEPSPELTDRIKLRLASCLLDRGARKRLEARIMMDRPRLDPTGKAAAQKLDEVGKKDLEAALEQVQTVTANVKSALLAHATYREAECQLHLGKPDEAIKLLVKFRDHGPMQNLPGLSDRALLRLGFALGEKKQWDQSRQAYERLAGSFGTSPWVHEARYGIGWAYQNQAQYDNAINVYQQVTAAVATDLAARAQLNIGVCRLLQKRYSDASTALLVVPFTYDYPELSALALVEAARACAENKETTQAVRLLRRVIKDHPDTVHAEAARKRLAALGAES
jgi:tetratricopeptide (TPR) repeat protein